MKARNGKGGGERERERERESVVVIHSTHQLWKQPRKLYAEASKSSQQRRKQLQGLNLNVEPPEEALTECQCVLREGKTEHTQSKNTQNLNLQRLALPLLLHRSFEMK